MESKLLRYQIDTIEGEIVNLLRGEALPLLDRLLSHTDVSESKAFYLKMKADYKRYLVEITFGKDREDMLAEAKDLYEQANAQCETLFSTHPLRLATAINHAVFLAECNHDLS
jgi:14-3-3 protein epsilon